MKLVTDYRGEVEYSEEDVILFQEDVYGFVDSNRYLLLGNIEKELPFYFLQSLDNKDYVLIVTNPFLFIENYDFEIDDWTLEQLNIEKTDDVLVYSVVMIPENVNDMTVNLRAPIIININNRKAKQIILDEDYPLREKIAKEA